MEIRDLIDMNLTPEEKVAMELLPMDSTRPPDLVKRLQELRQKVQEIWDPDRMTHVEGVLALAISQQLDQLTDYEDGWMLSDHDLSQALDAINLVLLSQESLQIMWKRADNSKERYFRTTRMRGEFCTNCDKTFPPGRSVCPDCFDPDPLIPFPTGTNRY